jgi:folate-binding protein YgfZ
MSLAKLEHYGLLLASGADARAFLHGQLTNDIEHLAEGHARYAGWCSAKGRLLATLLVIPHGEAYLLQIARDIAAPVAKRMAMFVLRSRVKLTEVSQGWLQYGAWGGAELAALGLEAPERNLETTSTQGVTAVCVEPERYLLLVPGERSDAIRTDAGGEAWALAEVRAGRPLVAQATQDQFVPQMVNFELAGGVDFKKGCYPGQEIVARAQYKGAVKRRMYRLHGTAPLSPGQDLYSDAVPGEPSGTVVNAARGEALAVLQVSAVEAGSPIRAQPQGPALEVFALAYGA